MNNNTDKLNEILKARGLVTVGIFGLIRNAIKGN